MHHFVTEMCTHVHTSVTRWSIVGYRSGALWDLCNRSCIGNTMAIDVLAMQGTRASTAMMLTNLFQNIPVSAPEGLEI